MCTVKVKTMSTVVVTASTIVTRPVTKLCLLEMENDAGT